MLVLIFTMSAFVSANAATYFEENGFKYSPISKFNCRIYGYTGTDKNVSVPNKLSSFTVLKLPILLLRIIKILNLYHLQTLRQSTL